MLSVCSVQEGCVKMAGRFIKLYDKILQWEWYRDVNTFRLFIHLLLRANYKDLRFEGRTILRGQLVTSLPSLASETGLTQRQVRVSLDRLKMTGEVSSSSCPRYRIITIVKYDEYQSDVRQNVSQTAGEMSPSGQAHDRLMTGSRQAHDRLMTASIDNIDNIEQIEKVEPVEKREGTAKRFTPPTKEEILDFCLDEGLGLDVDYFYDHYTSNGWMVGKNRMKDWKATARNWVRRDQEMQRQSPQPQQTVRSSPSQQYSQRDYSGADDEAMRAMMAQFRKDGLM